MKLPQTLRQVLLDILICSPVSTATSLRAGRTGFYFRHEQWRNIFPPPHPYQLWTPPSLLSIGYRGLFLQW